jgi:hypothetical protein
MNDDNNWYVVEVPWGSELFPFEPNPAVFKVLHGPCAKEEARKWDRAYHRKHFGPKYPKWRAYEDYVSKVEEERMRNNPALRERHEQQKRRQEEERKRDSLVQDVITAGFKAMAKKMHPDVGGDGGDMLLLFEVRNYITEKLDL